MMFFKRTLPILICAVTGVLFAVQYYVPHPGSERLLTTVNDWLLVIGGFAAFLGIGNLFLQHGRRIRRQEAGWGYSIVMFAGFLSQIIPGILDCGKTNNEATGALTGFGWAFFHVYVPLDTTMFAMLGFFVASAAFRTFRARSFDATLLLTAAVIIMFGRVPLGEYLWNLAVRHPDWQIGSIAEWVMKCPNLAAQRGIMMGIALGIMATSLKMIFGIERSYLGGGKDA